MPDATSGITSLPGFRESLRLLVQDEKYSLLDIGLMFGVSRERIRQLADRFDIIHTDKFHVGMHCVRVWDDVANRFRPEPKRIVRQEQRERRRQTYQQATRQRIDARRARLVATIRETARELGRSPTHQEVADRYFGKTLPPQKQAAPYLIAAYGGGRKQRNQPGLLARLYREAGVEPGAPGWGGRRDQRKPLEPQEPAP